LVGVLNGGTNGTTKLLGNGLDFTGRLGGDGVLESLSGRALGLQVVEDGGALSVGGELVTNGLQVGESTVQGGLEALDVAGDANSVGEGELGTAGDGGSTAQGAGLDLLGCAGDTGGLSGIGLYSRVEVLEVRCNLG